jgi:hypothetical protein
LMEPIEHVAAWLMWSRFHLGRLGRARLRWS